MNSIHNFEWPSIGPFLLLTHELNVTHKTFRKDLPGLAHFLEHMLFTGTTKYPKEGGGGGLLVLEAFKVDT